MSLLSIIDPRARIGVDPSGAGSPLIFDITDEELHAISVALSGDPREFADDARDGYYVKPRVCTIRARFVHASDLRPISLPGFVQRQWALIKALAKQPFGLTVSTRLETYRNMRIKEAEMARKPGRQKEGDVTITLQQVRVIAADVPEGTPTDLVDANASEVPLGPVGTVAQPA